MSRDVQAAIDSLREWMSEPGISHMDADVLAVCAEFERQREINRRAEQQTQAAEAEVERLRAERDAIALEQEAEGSRYLDAVIRGWVRTPDGRHVRLLKQVTDERNRARQSRNMLRRENDALRAKASRDGRTS